MLNITILKRECNLDILTRFQFHGPWIYKLQLCDKQRIIHLTCCHVCSSFALTLHCLVLWPFTVLVALASRGLISFRENTLTTANSRSEAKTNRRHTDIQTSMALMYETRGSCDRDPVLWVVIVRTVSSLQPNTNNTNLWCISVFQLIRLIMWHLALQVYLELKTYFN